MWLPSGACPSYGDTTRLKRRPFPSTLFSLQPHLRRTEKCGTKRAIKVQLSLSASRAETRQLQSAALKRKRRGKRKVSRALGEKRGGRRALVARVKLTSATPPECPKRAPWLLTLSFSDAQAWHSHELSQEAANWAGGRLLRLIVITMRCHGQHDDH